MTIKIMLERQTVEERREHACQGCLYNTEHNADQYRCPKVAETGTNVCYVMSANEDADYVWREVQ